MQDHKTAALPPKVWNTRRSTEHIQLKNTSRQLPGYRRADRHAKIHATTGNKKGKRRPVGKPEDVAPALLSPLKQLQRPLMSKEKGKIFRRLPGGC